MLLSQPTLPRTGLLPRRLAAVDAEAAAEGTKWQQRSKRKKLPRVPTHIKKIALLEKGLLLPCGATEVDRKILDPNSIFHWIHVLQHDDESTERDTIYFTRSKSDKIDFRAVPRHLVDITNVTRVERQHLITLVDGAVDTVTTLKNLVSESMLLLRIDRIPFFSSARKRTLTKVFTTWAQLRRVRTYHARRTALRSALFHLHPVLRKCIRTCKEHAEQIKSIALFVWGPSETNTLDSFTQVLTAHRNAAITNVSRKIEDIKAAALECCSEVFYTTRFDGTSLEFLANAMQHNCCWKGAVESKAGLMRRTQMNAPAVELGPPEGYVISFTEQTAVVTHTMRILRLFRLLDQMATVALHESLLAAVVSIADEIPNPPCFFHTMLAEHGFVLSLEPPPMHLADVITSYVASLVQHMSHVPVLAAYPEFEQHVHRLQEAALDGERSAEYSQHLVLSVKAAVEDDQRFTNALATIEEGVRKAASEVTCHVQCYVPLMEDMRRCSEYTIAPTVDPPLWETYVDDIESVRRTINSMQGSLQVRFFDIDASMLQAKLLPMLDTVLACFADEIPKVAAVEVASLCDELVDAMAQVAARPETAVEHHTVIRRIINVQQNHYLVEARYLNLKAAYDVLQRLHGEYSQLNDTHFVRLTTTYQSYTTILSGLEADKDALLCSYHKVFKVLSREWDAEVNEVRLVVGAKKLAVVGEDPDVALGALTTALQTLAQILECTEQCNVFHNDIGLPEDDTHAEQALREEANQRYVIWELWKAVSELDRQWKQATLFQGELRDMEPTLVSLKQKYQKLNRGGLTHTPQILSSVRDILLQYTKVLPVVTAILHADMKPAHWTQVAGILGVDTAEKDTITVADLCRLDAQCYASEVEAVAQRAGTEEKVRRCFFEYNEKWQDEEVPFATWDGLMKYPVFGDLLAKKCEAEDTVEVLACLKGKGCAGVEQQITCLAQKLVVVAQNLQLLHEMQVLWMSYETVFASPEMQRVTGGSKAFTDYDRCFRDIVKKTTTAGASLLHLLCASAITKQLQQNLSTAGKLAACVQDFLSARRSACPRLCLLDDTQLLYASESHFKTPNMNQILQLFGNHVENFSISSDALSGCQQVNGIISLLGDELQLSSVRVRGHLDTWVPAVDAAIKDSVKGLILQGIEEDNDDPVHLATVYPSHVALVIWRVLYGKVRGERKQRLATQKESLVLALQGGMHSSCELTSLSNLLLVIAHQMTLDVQSPLFTLGTEGTVRIEVAGETIAYGNDFTSAALPEPLHAGSMELFGEMVRASCGEHALGVNCYTRSVESACQIAQYTGRVFYKIPYCSTWNLEELTKGTARRILGAVHSGWWVVVECLERATPAHVEGICQVVRAVCDRELERLAGMPVGNLNRDTMLIVGQHTGRVPKSLVEAFRVSCWMKPPVLKDLRLVGETILAKESREILMCLTNVIKCIQTCCQLWSDQGGPTPLSTLLTVLKVYRCSNENSDLRYIASTVLTNTANVLSVETDVQTVIQSHLSNISSSMNLADEGPPKALLPIINLSLMRCLTKQPLCLVGEVGSGKTPVIKYVSQQIDASRKTVAPSAVTARELYGYTSVGGDWQEGLIPNIVVSALKNNRHTAIVLDADNTGDWMQDLIPCFHSSPSLYASPRDGFVTWNEGIQFILECRSLGCCRPGFLEVLFVVSFETVVMPAEKVVLWAVQSYLNKVGCEHYTDPYVGDVLLRVVSDLTPHADGAALASLESGWQVAPTSRKVLLSRVGSLFATLLRGLNIDSSEFRKRCDECMWFAITWGVGGSCIPSNRDKLLASHLKPSQRNYFEVDVDGVPWGTRVVKSSMLHENADVVRCREVAALYQKSTVGVCVLGARRSGKTTRVKDLLRYVESSVAGVTGHGHHIDDARHVYTKVRTAAEKKSLLMIVVEDMGLCTPALHETVREVVSLGVGRSKKGTLWDLPANAPKPCLIATLATPTGLYPATLLAKMGILHIDDTNPQGALQLWCVHLLNNIMDGVPAWWMAPLLNRTIVVKVVADIVSLSSDDSLLLDPSVGLQLCRNFVNLAGARLLEMTKDGFALSLCQVIQEYAVDKVAEKERDNFLEGVRGVLKGRMGVKMGNEIAGPAQGKVLRCLRHSAVIVILCQSEEMQASLPEYVQSSASLKYWSFLDARGHHIRGLLVRSRHCFPNGAKLVLYDPPVDLTLCLALRHPTPFSVPPESIVCVHSSLPPQFEPTLHGLYTTVAL